MAAVPLAVQDRVLGVLEVLHHAPRDFSQEDVDFLEGLATQAALAIDNVRLLGQMQARLRETETLLELGQTVIPALDLAERMRLLARGASRAFGADTVGAYLADPGGTELAARGRLSRAGRAARRPDALERDADHRSADPRGCLGVAGAGDVARHDERSARLRRAPRPLPGAVGGLRADRHAGACHRRPVPGVVATRAGAGDG